MKKHITLFILCMFLSTIILGQTQLQGKVTEDATGEPVLFGTVALYKGGVLITGTETDFDGNYFFSDIDPGTYDVEVSYVGLQKQRITGVVAKAGKVTPLNFKMKEEGELIDVIEVVGYKVPLIEMDNTTSGATLTAENIEALPTKAISAIAATTAGVSVSQNGAISVRGARTDATFYYVDGVRVNRANAGNLIPQADIEQLQVITGGIEARYGDVTGGVISITSRGPSNRFTGGIEAETSEYLDAFGYNLLNANFSGPLLKKTMEDGSERSIIGFRLFGQYRNISDDNPSAVGVYRAPLELIEELEANPLTVVDGVSFPTAQFLTTDDIPEPIRARPNETDRDFNVSAKIDARVTDNIDLSFSGAYYDSKNQFTPGGVSVGLLNWNNNPFALSSGFRTNLRLRHKIGRQGVSKDQDKTSLIRNASYSIQVGYERGRTSQEDPRHQQDLFNYGYYGVRDVNFVKQTSEVTDTNFMGQTVLVNTPQGPTLFGFQGLTQVVGEFTPDPLINPTLAFPGYNELNGFTNVIQSDIFNMFTNVGRVHNVVNKSEEDRYTVNIASGFDLFPGSSESGKHSIQFGFTYEQRLARGWGINPVTLWELMRANINRHIENGVDTSRPDGLFLDPVTGEMVESYLPNDQSANFPGNKFFRAVRDELGAELTDFINIDAVDPSRLRLDMFSPGELLNQANLGLGYSGFDYLGNKIPASTSFNDFFTGVDDEGRRTFNVAPFNPIYIAGYLQDKFTFKDIIFRLGVRLDYYDANTQVLRDPFSLVDIQTAEQFYADNPELTRPASIPDDYKVYVDEDGGNEVVAYRRGEEWFQPDGTATEGNLLFGGGLVFPAFVEGDELKRNPQLYERLTDDNGNPILDANGVQEINAYDPNISFTDYDPQLNVMPRLAFSFPISEDAGFFAHYDVLVQRPNQGRVFASPLNYYFFNIGRFNGSNPDLRPEKTIDYEVGFQQKVSNSSAIKLSLYYRELRDMIQARTFNFVPTVGSYQTFSNIDFGTVKGFVFSYDLRRTNNFQLNASYTFQNARGTGSNATSSAGINGQRNIRTLLPLSFDETHALTLVADYRYGSGNAYNGPRIGDTDILANFGVNLLLNAISGRPFSTFAEVTSPTGASVRTNINENRLPWVFTADLQADKNFSFKLSEESNRNLGVNVYLRIQNLFDLDNVVGVFPVSQSPDDSGWLRSTLGNNALNAAIDNGFTAENYLSAYQWRILTPGNYARPRRIYLGAIVNF